MSSFTFFNQHLFTKGCLVYPGTPSSRSQAESTGAPLYNITHHLCQVAMDKAQQPCMTGKYHGFGRRKVDITGRNFSTVASRTGVFDKGWSFIDSHSNEFVWHVSLLNHKWALMDGAGREVAGFKRAKFSRATIGCLELYEEKLSEQQVDLIILSAGMVYRTVKRAERRAAASASSGGG